jgi:hypothetical protein
MVKSNVFDGENPKKWNLGWMDNQMWLFHHQNRGFHLINDVVNPFITSQKWMI